MSWCCSKARGKPKNPLVDVEKVLTEHAWRELAEPTWCDKLLRRQRYTLEVDWNYIDVSHCMSKFKSRVNTAASDDQAVKDVKCRVSRRDLFLFRTQFINRTKQSQKFTFRTERQTKSSCHISIQKGLKVGGKVDLKFKLPTAGAEALANAVGKGDVQLCDATGGLSMEMSLTKTTGHSYEETLTWSVDNEISADQDAETIASLVVKEEELTADYTLESTFRPLRKVVPVYLRHKKTGDLLEILEIPSDNLPEIFAAMPGFCKVPDTANQVRCDTKGTCRAVYGAKQQILIESYPLSRRAAAAAADPEQIHCDASMGLGARRLEIADVTDETQ